MNTADMSFVARIGWYGTFILPEHVFNNGQAWSENPASTTPVTCGPFKLESYTQGSNITLVANEDYVDGAPKVQFPPRIPITGRVIRAQARRW